MINTPTYKNFPLNKLIIAPENVRVVNPSKQADKELIASIRSLGLLQNLNVDECGNGKGKVIAGGRRFAALEFLVKSDDIPCDYMVPCRVSAPSENVKEISLAENTQRANMHPADEYVAFSDLREQGFSVTEISNKFGIPKKTVEQRLALGSVAPKIMEQYRTGKIDLKCTMAFTICPDHERQMACYKELSRSNNVHANNVKRWLVGESYNTNNGLGKFVGKAAFTKAGGSVSSDLFEETVYLADPELVIELANKKLEKEAAVVLTEGWNWVKANIASDTNDLVRLQPKLSGVPKKLIEKLAALKTEKADVETQGNEQGWPDELDQKDDALEEEISELEESRDEKYLKFTKEQMAYSGAILSVDYQGKLSIDRGLAHKKDVPQPKGESGEGTDVKSSNSNENVNEGKVGISQALKDDLLAYRQQATQAALLNESTIAIDVLHYSIAVQMLGARSYRGPFLDTTCDLVESISSRDDTQEGRAHTEINTAASALNTEWLSIEDEGKRFVAFRNLETTEKALIMTYCVARSLRVQHKGSDSGVETLIDLLGVEFAKYWRPTSDNYLKRMNIVQVKDVFLEVGGDNYDEHHKDKSKGAVVANTEELIKSHANGKNWLPEQF